MPESELGDDEYTVVLRSASGARVRLGQYIDLNDFPDGFGGRVQVRISARWDDLGLEHPVPRELWIAVRVKASSVDAALRSATAAASVVAIIISFCVNALVEPPALHIVFNSTEGLSRRQFMEVFLPDERGLPRIGRWIDVESLFGFGAAAYSSPEVPRLFRALAQYQVALRYWNTGSQVLALAHLYITCEVLTKAVLRVHQADLGLTEEEHATRLGVDTSQDNWRMMAGNFARRAYIFKGNKTIYDATRQASDQFEHGTADLGNVHQTAASVTREVFDLVRAAILSLVPALDQSIADTIISKHPIDVSPLYKQVTGYIVSEEPSDPLNLGVAGQLFPLLRWQSGIKASRIEDDQLIIEPEETMTVEFAPGLQFEGRDIAVYGGLNPSPASVTIPRPSGWGQPNWVASEIAPSLRSVVIRPPDLLSDVMGLVDAATISGAEIRRTYHEMLAFNLFGQGVAYFQAAQTLIGTGQPVEALSLVRGLVTIAARFEQMTEDGGEGLGLVVRLAVDSFDNDSLITASGEVLTTKGAVLQSAVDVGLVVPGELRPPETTAIWQALSYEMDMARDAVSDGYWTVILHLKSGDEGNGLNFHTKLGPSAFSDLLVSACAIAQLELAKSAAAVFGWATDIERLEALLTVAKDMNAASAGAEAADSTGIDAADS